MGTRPLADTYDLSELTELSEEAIGRVLQERYSADRIYTLVGDILVFLNPFRPVNVYTEREFSCLCKPDWRGPVAVGNETNSTAHIYTVGAAAFRLTGRDSTVLISGESGSGKTESTKLLLQQFVRMAGDTKPSRERVSECLLAANPVMEAFGNARTVMNHNSSRFAKFVSLGLQDGALVLSEVRTYMLEKSRLVSAADEEGNFHVFYYMCLSANSFFRDVKPQGQTALVSNLQSLGQRYADLEAKASELLDAFDRLGFSVEQKTSVFQILSGLLALGDVQFRAEEQNHNICTTLDPSSDATFKKACQQLGVKGKEARRRLLKTMTTGKIKVNEEDIYSMFQEDRTRVVLNGCIRAIYARLFEWIIQRINESLSSAGTHQASDSSIRYIGVLDIFGFECLSVNSFEQLCINLANEQLQLFFTHHVIQLEQSEYRSEGLAWVEIPFEDNQVALNLFLDKPLGALSLLNEESSLASGTDESLYHKMMKHLSENPRLTISDRNATQFTVSHFAGSVSYTIPGMVNKNRDRAPEPTLEVLATSKMKLMCELCSIARSKAKQPSAAGGHLAVQFRSSLDYLLAKLKGSQPFFVRCIKPNRASQPSSFTQDYVAQQIHYCGIAEAVRVRRAGYPVRCVYTDLRTLCPVLCFLFGSGRQESEAARVRAVLNRAGVPAQEAALGRSKVFLRAAASRQLAAEECRHLVRVVRCQTVIRGFLGRRRYARLKVEEAKRRRRSDLALPTQPAVPAPPARNPVTAVDDESTASTDDSSSHRVARSETVRWFQVTQKDAILQTRGYNAWFHGIITRQDSNSLLADQRTGSFLLRVSNSRLGFVLSFKSRNGIRHYLVEQLERGRFNVVGERQIHSSLGKLVEFHRANGFGNCDVRLTHPVGQRADEPDYEELFCSTAL